MGYFVSATKEKEAYIASTQFLFAFTGVINLVTRMINRIYTLDLIPATILGF